MVVLLFPSLHDKVSLYSKISSRNKTFTLLSVSIEHGNIEVDHVFKACA